MVGNVCLGGEVVADLGQLGEPSPITGEVKRTLIDIDTEARCLGV